MIQKWGNSINFESVTTIQQLFRYLICSLADSSLTMSSSSLCKDTNRSSNNSAPRDGMFHHKDSYIFSRISNIKISLLCLCVVWVGEEGTEIKRQITGMMRLLSDKSGKVYQRVTTEQDSTKKESQGRHLSWPQEPAPLPGDHQGHSWNSAGDPGPSPLSASRPKETIGPNKVHESYGRTKLRRRNLKILQERSVLLILVYNICQCTVIKSVSVLGK